MGRGGTGGRIAVGLDDRVVLWEPQPSHLARNRPREWSLVSLVPLLNILWESVGSKIRLEGLVCIGFPRVYEHRMVGHVLSD